MIHDLDKMKIQFHTDKNFNGSKASTDAYIAQIESELGRFSEVITHLEVHLSDDDVSGTGVNTKKCALEIRLKERKPIAVTHFADTYEEAVGGALDNLTASLDDQG
jgi:hypothetical protein